MPQAFNPLTPPNMAGATTISDTGFRNVAWPGTHVNLSDTTDYILDCPVKRTGKITIDGGRNIFIPRLWVELPAGSAKPGELISVANGPSNRIIHIEHAVLDPNGVQADCIKTHGNSNNMILQMKFFLCKTLRGTTLTGGVHADLVQTSAGLKELWAEDVTCYTDFDGFMNQQEASLNASYTKIAIDSCSVTGGVVTYHTHTAHNLNTSTRKYFQISDDTASGTQAAAFSGGFMVQSVPNSTTITANFGDGTPAAYSGGAPNYTIQEMTFPYSVGDTNLNRVNIIGLVNPTGSPTTANQAIRFGARTAQNSGFNSGHPNDDATPVDLEAWNGTFTATNFYGTPPTGRNAGQFVQPDTGGTWSVIRPTYHSTATPPYVDWPTHPKVTAGTKMVSGPPPGGDYATDANAFNGFGGTTQAGFDFSDGFESSTTLDPGWTTVVGTPTITTASAQHGVNGLRITGAGSQFISRVPNPASPTILVDRFYLRVPSGGFPTGADATVFVCRTATPTSFKFNVTTAGILQAQVGAGTVRNFGTLTPDQSYCVDFRANSTAGTIDWKVDTVTQTQATGTTGSTFANIRVGNEIGGVTAETIHIDDVYQSTDSADYPIGPLAPNILPVQQRLYQRFTQGGPGSFQSSSVVSTVSEVYTPANNGIFQANMDALNLGEFNGTNFLGTAGTAIQANATRPFAGAGSLQMSKQLAGTSVSELVYAEASLASPTNHLFGRFYFNLDVTPNGTAIIHPLYAGTGFTQMQFRLSTEGYILQMWLPGTSNQTQKLFTFVNDTWYRVEYEADMSLSTQGQMTAKVFLGSSTTPLTLDQVVGSPTSYTGTITTAQGYVQGNIQKPRWGCANATPTTGQWYFDKIRLNSATDGYPGP